MNRVSAQSEDLRKMQQEAMRRVQEMQNKSQSYVRGGNDRYTGSFNMPRQNEQETVGNESNEYEKTRERSQNVKQSQRVRPSPRVPSQQIPVPPAAVNTQEQRAEHTEHTESTQEREQCAEDKENEILQSLSGTNKEDDRTDDKKSCSNNDIIIVLLILMLLNGSKSNSALILALVSLFI